MELSANDGRKRTCSDNPSGHPMIVPQSTPTRQPVELPVERPAMVPRAELEAVEAELGKEREKRDKMLAAIESAYAVMECGYECAHWSNIEADCTCGVVPAMHKMHAAMESAKGGKP